uniref:Cytochrome c oxidase subunit 1 n=1 Tax=Mesocestoides corti TaxID=53468 RepID=A0A5K3FZ04_MESCO
CHTPVGFSSSSRAIRAQRDTALLTNQKSDPHIRRLSSESTTLAAILIIYYSSAVSFSGWLLSSSHAIGSQRDTGLAEAWWSNMSAPRSDATVPPPQQ